MVAEFIGFSIRNLPALSFVLALVIAVWRRRHGAAAERLLAWILLLPIGVTGLWAGVSQICFPAIAAAHIGRQVVPFQFEVGMADLAIGVTACLAFRRDLDFKAAVGAPSIFLPGDAIGHVRQMMVANNFVPDNAGVPFYRDVICPVLGIALVAITKRSRPGRINL